MAVKFCAGRNVALKIPPHEYAETVRFYGEVLGLPRLWDYSPDVVFDFGGKNLWLDNVEGLSQAETWLEVCTDDLEEAAQHLAAHGVIRRDEIEPLPEGFEGFWITNAAGIIHLVCGT